MGNKGSKTTYLLACRHDFSTKEHVSDDWEDSCSKDDPAVAGRDGD